MQKSLIFVATAATLAVASLAVASSAEARSHHGIYRNFGAYVGAYAFSPWYAPRYGYAAPYRYYDRFGSNLNPDRQMVGIGE